MFSRPTRRRSFKSVCPELLEQRLVLCALPHTAMTAADVVFTDAVVTLAAASATAPGTIEAEAYDSGGEGVAYHDAGGTNLGGQYRSDGVDIKTTADAGGGYAVGWTATGEWLKYTVNISADGQYDFSARVASQGAGGKFKLYVDDVDHSGTMNVPNTGGWDTFTTITKSVGLSAGTHELKVLMTGEGASGGVGNFNWFKLTPTDGTTPPPTDLPTSIRINVGGPSYVDTSRNQWVADLGFASGGTVKSDIYPVANTTNDTIYATRRFGNFSYHVPVQNGTYSLQLYFAEPYWTKTGQRKFDMFAEGQQVLNDYDILTDVAPKSAMIKTFTVSIQDSALDLQAVSVVDTAILSGIVLTQTAPSTPTTVPFQWKTAAPNPQARYESQGAVANGRMYVFGGFYVIDNKGISRTTQQSAYYDPVANKWTNIASIPEAITHAGVAVDGNNIWLAGGFIGDNPGDSTAHVWRYNTVTNTYTAGPSLPADRAGGALVRIGRELHFVGGGIRHNNATITQDFGDHWVLNLDNVAAGWTVAPSMPNPRNHTTGVEINGKMYVLGGQHLQEEYTGNQSEMDVYDPATRTWKRVADLPIPLGHIQSAAVNAEGRIIVAGGVTTDKERSASVYAYDPSTNSWVTLTPLPAGRQSLLLGYIDGKLIATIGLDDNSVTHADTWVGDISHAWEKGATIPKNLGEVSAGVIGDHMIIVGEGSSSTLAYDFTLGAWGSTTYRAIRPYVGNHHAAEVIGDRLYLFGGLGGGSEGKVQYYDDSENAWHTGASMPFAAGSSASAYIGGYVYVAGGIVGSTTTNRVARYNPTTNTWNEMAPMPVGVNHAASTTDGKKLYVFGGRAGGNVPSNGFNYVQIYDPATNTWTSSTLTSSIAPLPQARGGMGKAVYYDGEFYIMGGETQNGAGATNKNVYARVDVYNPVTNTWRRASDMITARHGIFPVLKNGRIYVAGGGIQSSFSQSNLLEILNLD